MKWAFLEKGSAHRMQTLLVHFYCTLYTVFHLIHLLSKWRVEVTEIAMPHLRCIWIYFYRYIYVQNTDRFEVVPTTIYTQKTNTTAWHQSDWALYGCNVSLLTLHYIELWMNAAVSAFVGPCVYFHLLFYIYIYIFMYISTYICILPHFTA